LITATIAAAVGAEIYEARQVSNARTQVETLRQQQAPLAEQIQKLQRERDDALKRLASPSTKPAPHLPAPPLAGTTPRAASPTNELPLANPDTKSMKDQRPQLRANGVQPSLGFQVGRLVSENREFFPAT
jgi:hypothetical protein